MKIWMLALAFAAATADLEVRTTPDAVDAAVAPTVPDVVQAFPPPLATEMGELRRGTPKRGQRDGGRPAVNNTLTAVPGIKVGHFTLAGRPTGCTVVLFEAGATASVDVRG